MLKVGDKAPEFQAKTTDGREVGLADYRGKRLIVYFFPKAFTAG